MWQTNRTGRPIDQGAVADDFGDGAEWYLTVRCASSKCGQLIAFQKALYAGDQPNLRIAITGEPTVRCPHCRTPMRVSVDQIKRRRIVVMQ
jgi:hypothetical protein